MPVKKITIKQKPTKPKRKLVAECLIIEDGTPVDDILDFIVEAEDNGVSSNKLWINMDVEEDYYEQLPYARCNITYKIQESEKDFNKRMDVYKVNIIKYNKWHKENKGAIEEEKKRRRKKQTDKLKEELARAQTKADALEKRLAKIDG